MIYICLHEYENIRAKSVIIIIIYFLWKCWFLINLSFVYSIHLRGYTKWQNYRNEGHCSIKNWFMNK